MVNPDCMEAQSLPVHGAWVLAVHAGRRGFSQLNGCGGGLGMPSIGACCCWGARLALPGFVGGWVRTQGRTCTPASPLTAHHLVFDYASVSLSRGLPRTFWMFPLDSLSLNRHNARLLRWSGFGSVAAGRPWGSGAGVPREGGAVGPVWPGLREGGLTFGRDAVEWSVLGAFG